MRKLKTYKGKRTKKCFLCGEDFHPIYYYNKETICDDCFCGIFGGGSSIEWLSLLTYYVEPLLKKDLNVLLCIPGVL